MLTVDLVFSLNLLDRAIMVDRLQGTGYDLHTLSFSMGQLIRYTDVRALMLYRKREKPRWRPRDNRSSYNVLSTGVLFFALVGV